MLHAVGAGGRQAWLLSIEDEGEGWRRACTVPRSPGCISSHFCRPLPLVLHRMLLLPGFKHVVTLLALTTVTPVQRVQTPS